MKTFNYKPVGVCSKNISFSLDEEGRIFDLKFTGGCPGNLNAISRLLNGQDAKKVSDILRGNLCRNKGTSCADQLSKAIDSALVSE